MSATPAATAAPRSRWTPARRRTVARIAFAWLAMVVYILPIVWMIKSSFQKERDIRVTEVNLGLTNPTLDNYITSLTHANFQRWFTNSLILSLSTMVIAVVVCTLAAYSLARLRNRFTILVGRFFLLAYIVPSVMIIIPLFVLITDLGLQNTYQGLIITYTSFAVPFGTWMLRAYFASLPVELEDAALVDGCSRLGALARIVFPLAAPGIVTVALFAFVLAWNDLLFAIVFTRTDNMKTLASGLVPLMGSIVGSDAVAPGGLGFGALFAMCLLVALPVMLVFIFLQNWLVRGLAAGAVKG
jgi:multiple sugar transport system permease protein